MKYKYIVKTMLFAVLVIVIGSMLTQVLRFKDSDDRRIEMYYTETEDIDFNMLFVGSSHVHSNIDPHIIDEISQVNSFDLAVGSQKMSQSYYLLKEAMKYDNIDVVALELFSLYQPGELNTQKKARVSQRMRWSENKMEYLFEQFGFPEIFFNIVPLLRYHNNYSVPSTVLYNLKEYGHPIPLSNEYYRGFSPSTQEMTEEEFDQNLKEPTISKDFYTQFQLEESPHYEYERDYMERVIKLCQDNGIEVILFKSPVISYFGGIETYSDNYTRIVKEISAKYGVNYIDYNYLPITLGFDYTKFKDVGHLNMSGASIISTHFAEYYNALHESKKRNNDDYVLSGMFENVENKSVVEDVYDPKYGKGTLIVKVCDEVSFNRIAELGIDKICQRANDLLPYTASCIVRNVGGVPQSELKNILTLANGINGTDRYQYRTIEHIEGDYYRITTRLESNVGDYLDVRINATLPKGSSIEIYQVELFQDYIYLGEH